MRNRAVTKAVSAMKKVGVRFSLFEYDIDEGEEASKVASGDVDKPISNSISISAAVDAVAVKSSSNKNRDRNRNRITRGFRAISSRKEVDDNEHNQALAS